MKLYGDFDSKAENPRGEGKLWPQAYGGNANWDLGLCRVHFDKARVCENEDCKYRPDALSFKEQDFIRKLGGKAVRFLKTTAACAVRGAGKYTLEQQRAR